MRKAKEAIAHTRQENMFDPRSYDYYVAQLTKDPELWIKREDIEEIMAYEFRLMGNNP